MNEALWLKITEYTNQAMCYELLTSPSFGLVSPYTKGSHTDMDHFTFIDSLSVINKYMYKFARCGDCDRQVEGLLQDAIEIGLACEKDMFQKTKGVNTHKGLIFVLGILVVSTTKALYHNEPFEKIFSYAKQLGTKKFGELKGLENKQNLSHGETIYLKHQIAGVREEAALGFPTIQAALPVLNLGDRASYVQTLISIMASCEDTTIIHRLGINTLKEVQTTMKGLSQTEVSMEKLNQIESDYIRRGISPGGAADLYCATVYLAMVKELFNK